MSKRSVKRVPSSAVVGGNDVVLTPDAAVGGEVVSDDHGGAVSSSGGDTSLSSGDASRVDGADSSGDAVGALVFARDRVPVYSNGVCPLLVGDDSRVADERVTSVKYGVPVVTFEPLRLVVDPVECPTCKREVEGVSLSWSPLNPGKRDCMTAIAAKTHPVSLEVLAASDDGDSAKARRIAERHPLGTRVLDVLGVK